MRESKIKYQIQKALFGTSGILTIEPQSLKLEGPITTLYFKKEDVESIRYGVSDFRFYFLPVSRTFNIEIKNSQGKIMRIRMHSFFGIHQKEKQDQYIRIHADIHQSFFVDMAIHYVRLLNNGLTYELAGVFLTAEGILIKKDRPLVPWNRIRLATYFHSCSIYDSADPNIFRTFDFWHDWNASLLSAVVDYQTRVENIQI